MCSPPWASYHIIIFILIHVARIISNWHLWASGELKVQDIASGLDVLSQSPTDRHCRDLFFSIGVDQSRADLVRDTKGNKLEAGSCERLALQLGNVLMCKVTSRGIELMLNWYESQEGLLVLRMLEAGQAQLKVVHRCQSVVIRVVAVLKFQITQLARQVGTLTQQRK
ncbi:hypothetical protein KCU85_g109, partial [Aureobasidium melanogenum]